jgi:hypothetical protein
MAIYQVVNFNFIQNCLDGALLEINFLTLCKVGCAPPTLGSKSDTAGEWHRDREGVDSYKSTSFCFRTELGQGGGMFLIGILKDPSTNVSDGLRESMLTTFFLSLFTAVSVRFKSTEFIESRLFKRRVFSLLLLDLALKVFIKDISSFSLHAIEQSTDYFLFLIFNEITCLESLSGLYNKRGLLRASLKLDLLMIKGLAA